VTKVSSSKWQDVGDSAVLARRMLPVSWATFNRAFHDWDAPIRRAVEAANEKNLELITPRADEVMIADGAYNSYSWWEQVK
jgi:hypothetical protein